MASVEDKPYTSKPYPPFTTSTLQQEANRKLGFTARRTMQVAQSLYENGHITYMRTDSTNLATVAIEAARELVASQYGTEYLPDSRRELPDQGQERPGGARSDPPGRPSLRAARVAARPVCRADEFKLYDMIWKRTVASQMADARGRRITITIEGGGAAFQVGGKTIDFPGYLRAYVEGSDDPEAELADQRDGAARRQRGRSARPAATLEPKEHTTQPPARYNEASLTRALEELGIGRPEHLRLDHRHDSGPRVRLQARQCAGADLDRRSPCRNCSKSICPTWSTIASPPRWKTISTPSAAARLATSTTCRRSTSATATPG